MPLYNKLDRPLMGEAKRRGRLFSYITFFQYFKCNFCGGCFFLTLNFKDIWVNSFFLWKYWQWSQNAARYRNTVVPCPNYLSESGYFVGGGGGGERIFKCMGRTSNAFKGGYVSGWTDCTLVFHQRTVHDCGLNWLFSTNGQLMNDCGLKWLYFGFAPTDS